MEVDLNCFRQLQGSEIILKILPFNTQNTNNTEISLFSTTPTSCVECSALTLCLDIQSREKVIYPNLFYFFLNFLSILKSHTHSLIQMPFNIILMTQ